MPIHYAIDIVRGLVVVEMTGDVSAAQTVHFLERLSTDRALRPAMPQLVEMTRADAPPTAHDAESVAEAFTRLRHWFEGARCAVVVADPVMFGAIRQFASLAARAMIEVRPFLDPGEARCWLGVPVDPQ